MKVQSKTLIKWSAIFCTLFQGYALYKGQLFSPVAYCGAIVALFGGNSAHENIKEYLEKDKGGCQ